MLRDMPKNLVFVCPEYILFFSQDRALVGLVCEYGLQNNLYVNLETAKFHMSQTSFFIYYIYSARISIDISKVKVITE